MTKKILRLNLFLVAVPFLAVAQTNNITVTQDPRFEKILNEKRKINSLLIANEYYKIQIYSGDTETAKSTLYAAKNEFKNYDATIIFNTPNYKVLIGNFKTRIEAERNLTEVKKIYPNSLLIKPTK